MTRRPQAGLTLLEVLVVVALMAVIVGFAVLSVDLAGPERKAEQEAQRFVALLRQQCQDAVLDAQEYGVRFEPASYRFARWEQESWDEFFDPPLYRPRPMPPGFELSVLLDGRDVVLDTDVESHDPHVVCFSSGEMTPFNLQITTPAGYVLTVDGRPDGSLSVAGWSAS
jgi:general secretion pathway protein H